MIDWMPPTGGIRAIISVAKPGVLIMSFYNRHMKRGRTGGRLTGEQLVAIKGMLNLVIAECYAGTSVGQINVANEYYYGSPEPQDYDDMFDRLVEGVMRLKNGGGITGC